MPREVHQGGVEQRGLQVTGWGSAQGPGGHGEAPGATEALGREVIG